MWVYSGSSSSGEISYAKEETYRIARSSGAASSSRVIANVDHRTVGLLPGKVAVDFADACVGSFIALEVERDLLKEYDLSLTEVLSFHAVSVSSYAFCAFACSFCLISLDGYLMFRLLCRRTCS